MIYVFLTDSKGYFDMNETKSNEENKYYSRRKIVDRHIELYGMVTVVFLLCALRIIKGEDFGNYLAIFVGGVTARKGFNYTISKKMKDLAICIFWVIMLLTVLMPKILSI